MFSKTLISFHCSVSNLQYCLKVSSSFIMMAGVNDVDWDLVWSHLREGDCLRCEGIERRNRSPISPRVAFAHWEYHWAKSTSIGPAMVEEWLRDPTSSWVELRLYQLSSTTTSLESSPVQTQEPLNLVVTLFQHLTSLAHRPNTGSGLGEHSWLSSDPRQLVWQAGFEPRGSL